MKNALCKKETCASTARAYSMESLLSYLNVYRRGRNYSCPFHNDKNPSAYINADYNKLDCPACQNKFGHGRFSTIDVYIQVVGCDVTTAIHDICNLDDTYIAPEPVQAHINAKSYAEAIEHFTPYDSLSNRYKKRIDEFLSDRGLYNAHEVLQANNYRIGMYEYTHISSGQVHHNITFDFGTMLQSRGQGKAKYNQGIVTPFRLKVNSKREYVLVEGVTDALACAEMGYNSIILTGIGNWRKCKFRQSYKYIIGLDNDAASKDVIYQLEEYFNINEISYEMLDELYQTDFKDINELLQYKLTNI